MTDLESFGEAGREALREVAVPLKLWPRFRDGNARKPERQAVLLGLIDSTKLAIAGITTTLVDRFQRGVNGLASWYRDFLAAIRSGHAAGAMAALGTAYPEDDDLAVAMAYAGREGDYLTGFRDAIATATVAILAPSTVLVPIAQRVISPGLLARATSYGDALWPDAERVVHNRMTRLGYDECHRHLGGSERSCSECPMLAREGWIPIELLRPIGDTPCRSKCRCYVSYRKSGQSKGIAPVVGP